jgi:hypothetical protein
VLFFFILIVCLVIIKFNASTIKGKIGEYKVKSTLEKLISDHYIQFHDLYIPIENGKKTSQVDHIVLSPKGIFVIETKNYKGWITGSEQSQYWNQTNYQKQPLYLPTFDKIINMTIVYSTVYPLSFISLHF